MSNELDLANLREIITSGTPLAQSTVLSLIEQCAAAMDGEHVADELARKLTDKLRTAEAKLARVIGVHTPTNALMNPGRNERVVEVCTGCGTDDGNWQIYPCPTIRALDGAE